MPHGPEKLDSKARRAAQAEATRQALISAAMRLFVDKGYHHTGTEEVVAEADVGTRGALYHHFADKQALFEAVFIAVEEGLVMEAAKKLADPADGAFNQLRQGLVGFLDASLTRQVQRYGEQIRLGVGDGLARPRMRTQQTQVRLLHQVFGILSRPPAHEEPPKYRRMFLEHPRQPPSCLLGHCAAPTPEVRRKVSAAYYAVVTVRCGTRHLTGPGPRRTIS